MKTMKRLFALSAALAATFLISLLCGCGSTQVESTWSAPETTQINFKKLLVVMITPDGATRRQAEDAICEQLKGIDTIPSYTRFPDNEALKNGTVVRKTLEKLDIDGAIIVRLVSKNTEITSTAGPAGPYRTFWGAHGAWGWGGAWAGDIQADTVIGMETNIYEMQGSKLVWSAVTKTTDPTNITFLIKDAGAALREEMKKQGLIPSAK